LPERFPTKSYRYAIGKTAEPLASRLADCNCDEAEQQHLRAAFAAALHRAFVAGSLRPGRRLGAVVDSLCQRIGTLKREEVNRVQLVDLQRATGHDPAIYARWGNGPQLEETDAPPVVDDRRRAAFAWAAALVAEAVGQEATQRAEEPAIYEWLANRPQGVAAYTKPPRVGVAPPVRVDLAAVRAESVAALDAMLEGSGFQRLADLLRSQDGGPPPGSRPCRGLGLDYTNRERT
jgi:hypothetical protein